MTIRRRILTCTLMLAAIAGAAHGGEVELTGGRTVWGDVTLAADGGVAVAVPGRAVETFKLDAVSRATIGLMPADVAAVATDTNAILPWPWQAADVGKVRAPGRVTWEQGGAFGVTAAGWGAWSGVDSLHLVYQPLTGDGQVLARVTVPESAGSTAVGGVMIRESLDPSAPFAAVALGPKGPARLQARPWPVRRDPQQPDAEQANADSAASKPTWLRVTRVGDTFTAYRSDGGQSWEEVGTTQVKMKPTALIGLTTASTMNAVAGPVRFDRVAVIPGSPATTAAASALPPRGVVMADGTARPGSVTAITSDVVTFTADTDGATPQQLAIEDVTWVLLQPTFPALAGRSTTGAGGALLRTGDFFEGESITLTDGTLTVTSTVFGPKTFNVATDVTAISLRDPANWAAQWHVRDKAGTVFSGDSVRVQGTTVLVGKHELLTSDVREIYAPTPR